MSELGVVVIGRNEGERLRRAFDALTDLDATIVYVDSDSTDGSKTLARDRGIEVVELDLSTPFSAARARNEGFERLLEINPDVCFVQFLDGDCELVTHWPGLARRVMEERPGVAVVFGRLSERFPERSIYNRMADIEWKALEAEIRDDGTVLACGGIAMMRVKSFRDIGGFNASIPAGEEPELCLRLRRAGWLIFRLNAEMAWHDSGMLRFSQWARRQVRTGYGGLDFATRFGRGDNTLFRRQIHSARFWALGWPLTLITLIVGGSIAVMPQRPLAVGLLTLLWPIQAIRIAARNRSRANGPCAALAYGILTMVSKFFQMLGQSLYLRDRLVGRRARLIEYKFATLRTKRVASSS